MSNRSFQYIYTPKEFSGMVGLDYLSSQFEFILREKQCNAIIFSGPNGHGKSTLAHIFLLRLFCENPVGLDACLECDTCRYIVNHYGEPDMLRISGDQLIGEMVDYIENRCLYAPSILARNVEFIDDLDLAEQTNLCKLIRVLNRYPETLMVFTVTNLSKVPLPFRQRCKILPLIKADYPSLERLILQVCAREKILIKDSKAVSLLISRADQNPRIILTTLEMCKGESNELSVEVLNSTVIKSNLQQLTGKF